MKKTLFALLFALGLPAMAQTAGDPVLMTINGKDITRSEFEYSYNKNGNVEGAVEQKTIEEYVPMFVNYKLKVAAAEAAKLDTIESFKKEFLTYRDMQLTPYMVDQFFIDSICTDVYARTEKQLGGMDVIKPAHILIQLKQNAGEAEKQAAKQKADSIYNALLGGADFAKMAELYSADPGTAKRGGQLPELGPGALVKEFETAAYALKKGEMSQPVLSPYGYHIIKMTDRHALAPLDSLRPEIIEALKRQGIEEASAEYRIKKLVDASNGRLTRETVLDSVLAAHEKDNAELRYLVQEYHDGLLLYEASKRDVWDVAAADAKGLEQYYKQNKKKYAWTEPRFKGFVYQVKNVKDAKRLAKLLNKSIDGDWRKAVKEQFNKDSVTVFVTGPYICKAGENSYVDAYAFKTKAAAPAPMKGYVQTGVAGKVLKQPKSYLDVKAQVTSDYQEQKEKEWVESLRQRFPFSVKQDVLKTVNKH